ncbi:MAG: hypothetical protein JST54_25055 [Deltaproteobacteria bacterium]|nr:hypothetical protein [Deltaproteobacteria bacterium]
MKPGSYKSRPFALAVACLVLAPAVAQAAATRAHGLILPSGVQEVGENRYRASDSYEDTLKFFDKTYKGIPRKAIVNQPGIRAMHFEAVDPKSGYEGFNVYEKDKEVRIFIIAKEEQAAPKKSGKKEKGSK